MSAIALPVDFVVILVYNMTTSKGVIYMTSAISIRPSRDLRNSYSEISSLTRQNPVAITVNGREDTVLLSHEDYVRTQNYINELEAKLSVYSHLAQAKEDAECGRVQDIDDAFVDILNAVDNADI